MKSLHSVRPFNNSVFYFLLDARFPSREFRVSRHDIPDVKSDVGVDLRVLDRNNVRNSIIQAPFKI
jgi:hypothetical protein